MKKKSQSGSDSAALCAPLAPSVSLFPPGHPYASIAATIRRSIAHWWPQRRSREIRTHLRFLIRKLRQIQAAIAKSNVRNLKLETRNFSQELSLAE